MSKTTKLKKGVPALYRAHWLDTFCFAYMAGAIDNGESTTKAAEALQQKLCMSDEEQSVETLKMNYHRQRNRFYQTICEGEVSVEPDRLTLEIAALLKSFSGKKKKAVVKSNTQTLFNNHP